VSTEQRQYLIHIVTELAQGHSNFPSFGSKIGGGCLMVFVNRHGSIQITDSKKTPEAAGVSYLQPVV